LWAAENYSAALCASDHIKPNTLSSLQNFAINHWLNSVACSLATIDIVASAFNLFFAQSHQSEVVFNGSLVGLGSLRLVGSIGLGTGKFGTDKFARSRIAAT
jgi:hypothetical protein